MDTPTEAQVKEFWEWCGWIHDIDDGVFYYKSKEKWYPPDCSDALRFRVQPPSIDLNSLFKWAVPKIGKKNNDLYDIRFTYNKPDGVTCNINREVDIIQAQGKDPALALFWALDKVRK